jgi:hypothetical protein
VLVLHGIMMPAFKTRKEHWGNVLQKSFADVVIVR